MSSESLAKITATEFRTITQVENDFVLDDIQRDERKKEIVKQLKPATLAFLRENNVKDWLLDVVKDSRELEDVLSHMRHVSGGQEYFLSSLLAVDPKLTWYRGGTAMKWGEVIAPRAVGLYDDGELSTPVIDGAGNGVFNRPSLALGYLNMATRHSPVVYAVPGAGVLEGLQTQGIALTSEHGYDISITPGSDRKKYLEFCRKFLQIYQIAM
jgi:hypothetical protein